MTATGGNMRRYENVSIEKLIPYKNNAKIHDEKQIEQIAKSIKEFGFINPVLIDGNYQIIAGHGRILGAKRLGMEEVPCLFVEDLTDKQKRAYILADNRLTELGKWDKELLKVELEALNDVDFDITLTGFELEDFIDFSDIDEYYGDERERTNKAYNLDLVNYVDMTNDFWQMPVIENDGYVPTDLTGFNYAKTKKDKNTGIHFFVDDYQFERVWNNPEKYVGILADYDCILSPDFSLYMDMPMPMKIWNVYRSRQVGAYYQSRGLRVIPTISWAEKETFEFCFKGIPKGSIVAISTIGVKQNEDARKIWEDGVAEMIRQIEPSTIIVYGGKLEFDYGDIEVVYFENKVTERWSNGNTKEGDAWEEEEVQAQQEKGKQQPQH